MSLPARVRDLLWRRTPAERLRELGARWKAERVADEIRGRLDGGGILFLPAQTWFSTHFQRPHQMARALAAAGTPVVYCEPWRHGPMVNDSARAERRFVGVKDLGERLHLLRWPEVELSNLIARINPRAILMIWPWQAELFPETSRSQVVYEVIDDHELFPDFDACWKQLHLDWVRRADVLVASADNLEAQLKPYRDDVLLLPNAVTLADWEQSGAAQLPADMAAARRSERVIAYYGTFADWFDWPMLIHAAKARPNWSFVLIGPPYDGYLGPILARAAESPNIYYLGPKAYGELPAYMQFVDVATIPFVLNPITHACSPVKLFEYMAAGKPIVVTAMREVLKYKSVLVTESADDFVRKLDEAVAKRDDPAYLALLRQEAEQNTWDSRARKLMSALQAASAVGDGRPQRATPMEKK